MPFLARGKRRSSPTKGVPIEDHAAPGPSSPREKVVGFIRKRRVCCRFAFGAGCNPQGCHYVHDHVPEGYYQKVERQHRKDITPSDDPTTLKRARRKMAALRVMCYEGRGQRAAANGGSASATSY